MQDLHPMKYQTVAIVCFLTAGQLFAQTIQVSENLVLQQLSAHCYMHTQNNNNGLVYINQGEAILVSTPDSDAGTQRLIDWVRNDRQARIVGYLVDRWHPDAMGGLDVVQNNGIKTYAYELTRQIAREKGLPVANTGFDPQIELEVGNEKLVGHFLGAAHTTDGIVVWIPAEQVLFGGNEIRNYNGWAGNISDAQLDEWSATARRIKEVYGSARIVIPGHGASGGAELIDYTISLFDLPLQETAMQQADTILPPAFKTDSEVLIRAETDSLINDTHILKNATVVVQDATKYVVISSANIIYQPTNKRFDSESGRVKIFDKKNDLVLLRTDVAYQRLMVYPYDSSVGYVVVLRAIEHH